MRFTINKVVTSACLAFYSGAWSADLSGYEKTCGDIGFKPRTPAFGECVLEFDRRATISSDGNLSAQRSAATSYQSPEDRQCTKFGFTAGTTAFAECRLKLELNKRDAQAANDVEQQRNRAQQEAAENQRQREQSQALIRLGAGLLAPPPPPRNPQTTCQVLGNIMTCN